jgi:hypothetical protein
MLSPIEVLFVRILRVAVVATAGVALLVAVGCLVFSGYAFLAPNPTPRLTQEVGRFRQALDPDRLIREVYPADSSVVKSLSQLESGPYQFRNATSKELYDAFNIFLDKAINAELENQATFEGWLTGRNQIPFSWSPAIDNRDAQDERSVAMLWRSLMLDYARRLAMRGVVLNDARKGNLYTPSLDKLIAPTGQSRAPYFIAWFFSTLQDELRTSERQLEAALAARMTLRIATPLALSIAAGAFAYFILAMLVFLFVSMEASARRIAETADNDRGMVSH